MHIEYVGRDAIVESEKIAFTYQVTDSPRDFQSYRGGEESLEWNTRNDFIGDFLVYSYGNNNDLPEVIREVVQNNYLAPGILKKKTQLLWGSGPKLYKEVIENRQLIKDWQDDNEIKSWLESWDYEAYLLQLCTEYQHMEGVFTKFLLSKGNRIGRKFIQKLEGVPVHKARLASVKGTTDYIPTHVVVTDWSFSHPSAIHNYRAYHKFDFTNPFQHRNAVLYSNVASFCSDYYTVPDLYGSLEWLRRSTATPLILKAFSRNAINLKYHIISPQQFWDDKEDELKDSCTQRGLPYKKSMLSEYKEELLKDISKVLSGEENTGKFWHTTKSLEVDGTNLLEHGWEIKVIDQKIKDFVEAQIKISERADRAVSAGIGLHGALGNVSESGKSDSGSEQIYALKNYMATGVDIPEMIVTKALNYALRANFPGKGLKIGFYHIQPEKEQDVSPEKRIKNIV